MTWAAFAVARMDAYVLPIRSAAYWCGQHTQYVALCLLIKPPPHVALTTHVDIT